MPNHYLRVTIGIVLIGFGLIWLVANFEDRWAYYLDIAKALWDPNLRIAYVVLAWGVYLLSHNWILSTQFQSKEFAGIGINWSINSAVARVFTKIAAVVVWTSMVVFFCVAPIYLETRILLSVIAGSVTLFFVGHQLWNLTRFSFIQRHRYAVALLLLCWFSILGLPLFYYLAINGGPLHPPPGYYYYLLFGHVFFFIGAYLVDKVEIVARWTDVIYLIVLAIFFPVLAPFLALSTFFSNF